MTASFDPYFKWLGIPPEEQPPNHYRLLGIPLFVDDPDVIENAADRQMAHVRTFQSGERVVESQKILNEIAVARGELLNTEKKPAYDARLRSELSVDQPRARPTPISVAPQPIVAPFEDVESPRPLGIRPANSTTRQSKARRPRRTPWIAALLGIAFVVAIAALVMRSLPKSVTPSMATSDKEALSAPGRPSRQSPQARRRDSPPLKSEEPIKKAPTKPANDVKTPKATARDDAGLDVSRPPVEVSPPLAADEVETADVPPTRIPPEEKAAPRPAADPDPLSRGLVAHYRFDETRGDVVHDSSGNDNHGKVVGSRLWTKGRMHRAVRLRSGAHVDFGDIGDFERTDSFSISCWVFCTKPGLLYQRKSPGVPGTGYAIAVRGDGLLSVQLMHEYATKARDHNLIDAPTLRPFPMRRWCHVTVTYDGSSRVSGVKVFIDGVRQPFSKKARPVDRLTASIRTSEPFNFGKHSGVEAIIDETRVYSRALSDKEVMTLYAARP